MDHAAAAAAKLLQSHPTLCDPMDSHLPGSSIHGIIILENQLLLTSPVQFSHLVVSDTLRPHRPQNARLPCPSPTPGPCAKPCPVSWRCHPTISSSVVPFSSCFQSFPASGSFPMSQFFTLGGQSIGVSASASVLPKNIQD